MDKESTELKLPKVVEEIKVLLDKFPEASGMGYVLAPAVAKAALDAGLIGYEEALARWTTSDSLSGVVLEPGEAPASGGGLHVTWDGPALCRYGDVVSLGIRKTLESIESAI